MRCLVVLAAAFVAATPAADRASGAKPRLVRNATTDFDRFLVEPTAARERWIRSRYFQLRGYSPFFEDNAMSWRPPPASFYQDLYAIYDASESRLIARHPDWVLRDLLGHPLFIPYACTGFGCPQYAADIGNPQWRSHWIARARRTLARSKRRDPGGRGYAGIFIDDVNLEMRVSRGDEQPATPLDPRTGALMDEQAWRGYMVGFVEQIRRALPRVQITHNALWWPDHADPDVTRQHQAADWIELERGFNDAGITPGEGEFGYETFLSHIDWLHRLGNRVLLGPELETTDEARYELANYYLIRRGRDAIESDYRTDPPSAARSAYWRGWRVNPGRSTGPRRRLASGLWRRDFTGGSAIVSPPGGPTVTVSFNRPHTNLAGETARSFELGSRSGDVYVRAASARRRAD